jgi:putative hydrolase
VEAWPDGRDAGAESTIVMDPVDALEQIATLLERERAGRYKEEAFRKAADAIRDRPLDELRPLAAQGRLGDLPGIGSSTARVIAQALDGEVPEYLARLEAEAAPDAGPGAPIRAALRGDLHLHSNWSDGGATIEAMARKAADLGHRYMALTDHSPSLSVAHGLDAERLETQLELVTKLNEELAPFRILTGIEVDILDDGRLDQDDDLLARLDVVVASVHSKLRMERQPMTERMVLAVASPHVDILGHCTGRKVTGKGRPESTFDAEIVFMACKQFDTAVEINCRPERLDPPRRLLKLAVEFGCRFSIDSDAHAPGQLDWQPHGCERAAECGVPLESIVNTMAANDLVDWAGSHA